MTPDVQQSDAVKILLVDDRPENLTSLTQVLQRPDLEILTAQSGNEALGLMLDHEFALVLLDVQMPGMDGFEVADLMRRHRQTANVPIIFVTAISKERRHLFSGYEAGAVDYLFKPIDPFIIRAKVAAFVELKRSQLARERLVAELNQANARLQEISDLKSDFLSAASHELRTPLTVIKEYCSLVHDELVGPLNEEQRRCLGSALRNCNRLANLVNDLLDLDSIESGHMRLSREKLAVDDLLRTCVADFQERAQSTGQHLELQLMVGDDPAATLPHVLAAPDMITQVLVNLLGNAHKFVPTEGCIEVRAAVVADRVRIDVQDDGPGISQEDQARVFEKFAQLDRRDGPGAKGTGLGLPISRKIIELHGGKLDLTSVPGEGSCFRFDLPVYTDEGHLQAFVADGTHNPTGLPVDWSLILVRPTGEGLGCEGELADRTLRVVRSSEDRTGVVRVAGRSVCAILLKTDLTGARSFLARLPEQVPEVTTSGQTWEMALARVAPRATDEPFAPESLTFKLWQPEAPDGAATDQHPKGVLHV